MVTQKCRTYSNQSSTRMIIQHIYDPNYIMLHVELLSSSNIGVNLGTVGDCFAIGQNITLHITSLSNNYQKT